jgi:hypothetical protein
VQCHPRHNPGNSISFRLWWQNSVAGWWGYGRFTIFSEQCERHWIYYSPHATRHAMISAPSTTSHHVTLFILGLLASIFFALWSQPSS